MKKQGSAQSKGLFLKLPGSSIDSAKSANVMSGDPGSFEADSCGIQDPRVVVGAFHASVKPQGLSGELPGGEGARVGQRAEGLSLDIAFFFPFGEIPQSCQLGGILHPLDDLK